MSDTKSTPFDFHAIIAWAKVFEQNRERKGYQGNLEGTGGQYEVDCYVDEENFDKIEASGSAIQPAKETKGKNTGQLKKFNEDLEEDPKGTLWRFKLRRKHDAPFTFGGAPQVVHADGETAWDINEDGLLGNGTRAVIYASVVDYGQETPLTRLEGVQVIDHVPYESDSDYSSGPSFKNYSKEPPKKPVKKMTKKETPADMDDEIPFNSGSTP